jgi:alpha-glucoside transport system substrate-binding protein
VPLSSRSFFVTGAIVVTVLVAATTGLAVSVVQHNGDDVDLARDQGLGVAAAVTQFRIHLAAADTQLAAALATGEAPSPVARTNADAELRMASQQLTAIGLGATGDDADLVTALADDLTRYLELVETSRAYPVGSRFHDDARRQARCEPVAVDGASTCPTAAGWDEPEDEEVPLAVAAEAVRLRAENDLADATDAVSSGWRQPWVPMAAVLALLVVVNLVVAGRTRIALHPGLVLCTLVYAVLTWGVFEEVQATRHAMAAADDQVSDLVAANTDAFLLLSLRSDELDGFAAPDLRDGYHDRFDETSAVLAQRLARSQGTVDESSRPAHDLRSAVAAYAEGVADVRSDLIAGTAPDDAVRRALSGDVADDYRRARGVATSTVDRFTADLEGSLVEADEAGRSWVLWSLAIGGPAAAVGAGLSVLQRGRHYLVRAGRSTATEWSGSSGPGGSGRRRRPGPVPGRQAAACLVVLVAPGLAGCTGAEATTTVTVFTPETGSELRLSQQVLTEFGERQGITIEVAGTRDFEELVENQIAAGDPPDIALYGQPGTVQELAQAELIQPLPEAAEGWVRANVDPEVWGLVAVGEPATPWAVPLKSDLKSLVWYNPDGFRQHGYEVPETFEDFLALVQRMAADGNPAFCVGIGSGEASGWPLTDWMEDFLLRIEGPELYDQWVSHEIPFDHPRVVAVAETVVDLWHQDGVVFGGTEAAAVTNFGDAVLPVVDGECLMHRGPNFLGVNWPEGVTFGPGGDIDAFRLPGTAENPDVVLTGGQFAVAFDDRPEVQETMSYLAGDQYAPDALRVAYGSDPPLAVAGSYLASSRTVDLGLYPDGITRELAEALRQADGVRFDASDMMPSVVGSGAFWSAAVDLTLGREDVAAAFAEVEDAWPDG